MKTVLIAATLAALSSAAHARNVNTDDLIRTATTNGHVVEKCIAADKAKLYVVDRDLTVRASDGLVLSNQTVLNVCASILNLRPQWSCPESPNAAVCQMPNE